MFEIVFVFVCVVALVNAVAIDVLAFMPMDIVMLVYVVVLKKVLYTVVLVFVLVCMLV